MKKKGSGVVCAKHPSGRSGKRLPTPFSPADWEESFRRPGLRVALVPSNKERKSTGSYFTPQHIVKYIVTNTVGPLLDEKFAAVTPKVRGYRALLDCLTAEHFGVAGASSLVTQGSDLDLEHWEATVKALPARDRRWIDEAGAISRQRSFFHWDVDFPDVFFATRRPAELRRFDAVVGNPPWGGLRTLGELESLLRPRLETAKKGTDFFALFVEIELGILHKRGRLGAVLPSGWQTADESTEFRKLLEDCARLETFVGLPYDTFEDANVDACVLTVSRLKFGSHPAKVLSYEIREKVRRIDDSDVRWHMIDPGVWHAIDPAGHQWLTFMPPDELEIARKLRERSVQLEKIACLIQRGITPYDNGDRPDASMRSAWVASCGATRMTTLASPALSITPTSLNSKSGNCLRDRERFFGSSSAASFGSRLSPPTNSSW